MQRKRASGSARSAAGRWVNVVIGSTIFGWTVSWYMIRETTGTAVDDSQVGSPHRSGIH
ncbi:hypothetical protein ACL02O_13430 [Micromonospora sp. MS34]|uniref:hypothetical protein n=1 Tax=Micromonospora sp. MS34 TaxID=3385971 RepID=UPI0039A0685F